MDKTYKKMPDAAYPYLFKNSSKVLADTLRLFDESDGPQQMDFDEALTAFCSLNAATVRMFLTALGLYAVGNEATPEDFQGEVIPDQEAIVSKVTDSIQLTAGRIFENKAEYEKILRKVWLESTKKAEDNEGRLDIMDAVFNAETTFQEYVMSLPREQDKDESKAT